MFEVSVQSTFCAAHAVTINGIRETRHGHNWEVTFTVAGPVLDADGILCDFLEIQRLLEVLLDRFKNQDLNVTPPFDQINPTAEHVAKYIAETMIGQLPAGVMLVRAAVLEAPGCHATYEIKRDA